MTEDLFREEAIRHRTRALYGDVILAAPIATWVITLLLIVIFCALCAFGLFSTISTPDGPLPIWRWAFGLPA